MRSCRYCKRWSYSTRAQVRHAATVVFPVDFDGGEHVYRVHPINVQMMILFSDESRFSIVLAMYVIVCTADVGNVFRTTVCTSPTVLEAEVLWSGLEFVMMVALC
jgi:hypothetical protein